MKIDFYIMNGQGLNTNYVGDYFFYRVHLENNDTDIITGSFTVSLFNTTHGLIHSREYQVSLAPGKYTDLYPNFTMNGRAVESIFFFATSGTYELDVASSVPIAFFTYFPDGKYIFQHNVAKHFFDALPASQKSLNDLVENWIHENEAWLRQSQEYAQEEKMIADRLYRLTVLTFFVTVVNALLVVWSTRQQERHRRSLFLYIYIAAILTIAALMLFGVLS